VLGLYQAGGKEPITQTMYNRLASYITAQSDIVINPYPGEELPPMTTALFGVHSRASGGDIPAIELSAIDRAQKFTSYKFLTGNSPNHYAAIAGRGIVLSSCTTRLFMDMRNRPKPTAAQFCSDMSLAITEAMNSGGAGKGVQYFEIHNEPNVQAVEWPWSADPHDFIKWILEVIPLLRTQHPGIKLISPGLAPAANTQTWWDEFNEHGVFAAVDAIGAHAYWPNRATMLTEAQGLNFVPLLQYASVTKPIYVTELSNNIGLVNGTDVGDPDHEKGLQYVDWCSYVSAHYPLVARSYWYALQSDTQGDNDSRQTLVRNGVITPIADGIRDGVFNPAPVEREFDHWLDEDTGANLGTANPLTYVITQDRHIKAITRPKVTPPASATAFVSTDGFGSVSGGGSYTVGSSVTHLWSPT